MCDWHKTFILDPVAIVRPVSNSRIQPNDFSNHFIRYINVFLTTLFLWPLFHSKMISPAVRKVAVRTLVYDLNFAVHDRSPNRTCFTVLPQQLSPHLRLIPRTLKLNTSILTYLLQVNIAVLTILKGKELGWVCLGSCTADVRSVHPEIVRAG